MKQDSKKSTLAAKIDKENHRIKILIFILLGLFVLVAGWLTFRPMAQHIPTVLSLKDKWESLEASAHEWQGDSYLTDLTFNVTGKAAYQVSAEYHSPSAPGMPFFVAIDNSGKIIAMPLDVDLHSVPKKPIHRQDWEIDSQEALNIFLKDEIASSCLESSGNPITLSLNRGFTEFLVWELILWNCPEEGKVMNYFLNAQTGEFTDPFK